MELSRYMYTLSHYSDVVNKSVANGILNISKLPKEVLALEGMSSSGIRHLLNTLGENMPNGRYLEIGSWKGSTFISALHKNNLAVATSIDYQLDYLSENNALMCTPEILKNNCALHLKNGETYELIVDDCYNLKEPLKNKYNIYLFDGPHEYLDQYRAITQYYDALDSIFIYICDDYSTHDVEQGTLDAFRDMNIEIITEHKMFGNQLMPGHTQTGFWNGYYIAVCVKRNDFPHYFKTRQNGTKWRAHRFAEPALK